jgi:hypothetical protein
MALSFSAFRPRRFVTNLLLLSFLVSTLSGVVLFFRPEGSLARWVGWSAFGLDKKQWEAVHLLFVGAFLIVSLVHILYNWRALTTSMRRRAGTLGPPGRIVPWSWELLAAIAVMAAVFAGTLVEWRPVAAVMALRTAMKDGAFVTTMPPPMDGADRATVAELCSRAGLSEHQALRNARGHGIVIVRTSLTLAAVALANDRSPEAVYRALLAEADPVVVQP